MIICTTKQQDLLNIIDNTYIKTRVELDKIVHDTYVSTTIKVEDDFIESEFITKGYSFIQYVEFVLKIKPYINFDYNDNTKKSINNLVSKLSLVKSNRTFALMNLQDKRLLGTIKHHLGRLYELQGERDLYASQLAYVTRELETSRDKQKELESNNSKLMKNNINLKTTIETLKVQLGKIKCENYNVAVYLKCNEEVQYTYTLLTFMRNMFSERGIKSSLLVILPVYSELLFDKWTRRGFIDLRTPLVEDTLNANKGICDIMSMDNVEVFTKNTERSSVLLILDKTCSIHEPISGDNIYKVDIGKRFIDGYTHYGMPPIVPDFANRDIMEMSKIYSNNDVMISIMNEVLKYV